MRIKNGSLDIPPLPRAIIVPCFPLLFHSFPRRSSLETTPLSSSSAVRRLSPAVRAVFYTNDPLCPYALRHFSVTHVLCQRLYPPLRKKARRFYNGGLFETTNRAVIYIKFTDDRDPYANKQQNVPYASKPLYGATRIRLDLEVRERFADRTTFCRRSAAMSRAEGKSKKTSQSKRGAFVNDVVLNIKT